MMKVQECAVNNYGNWHHCTGKDSELSQKYSSQEEAGTHPLPVS